MKPFSSIAFLTVCISFLFGAWWGFDQRQDSLSKSLPTVRILIYRNLISSQSLVDLETELGFKVQVTQSNNDQEFIQLITNEQNNYDIVFAPSFLLGLTDLNNSFALIDIEKFRQKNKISADFLSLPFDPGNRFVVPFFWGINLWTYDESLSPPPPKTISEFANSNFFAQSYILPWPVEYFHFLRRFNHSELNTWKESQPTEPLLEALNHLTLKATEHTIKNGLNMMPHGQYTFLKGSNPHLKIWQPESLEITLWVLYAGISKASPHMEAGYQFLDHLTQTDILKKITIRNSLATVYNGVVTDKKDFMLSPQYLRQVSLSNLIVQVENQAAFDVVVKNFKLPQSILANATEDVTVRTPASEQKSEL